MSHVIRTGLVVAFPCVDALSGPERPAHTQPTHCSRQDQTMNVNMERASFTSLLEHSQFGAPLQVPQQPMMQPAFGLQGMVSQPMSMGAPQFKPQPVQHHQAPAPVKLPADQSVPNVLQNMMSRSNSSKLTPSSVEASLLSLVDGELRVSSISNLPVFLKILPRCKTEPEQTVALVVLRATSTASDAKLSHACAAAFEKGGGLRVARAWVESAVAWQHNDLLVLLLEVLQTLPLQLTSITEARINEPIVKLRKNAREERVKRAAQDLLKFWRSKFTEKEKAPAPSSLVKEKTQDSSKPSSSTTASSAKEAPSTAPSSVAAKPVPAKQSKVLKKRTIKRLERLPFGGGSAVSKSSDLIGNLMQRKSAKEAAAAAAVAEKKKGTSSSGSKGVESISSSDGKRDDSLSTSDGSISATSSVDDALSSMPLPTIQSFKAASTSSSSPKERKRIRWADESGEELVKVKLIESWRDLVPYDPRHDDESFKDAKLREHANERHALLAQQHKVPPAVAASKSREWSTPAFIRLPEAVAARVDINAVTDEMHVQDSRRRHVDEYEVLAGEMPIPSPKEWERVNEPHRGPPLEIPLSDVVEGEPSSAAMMAPPTSSAPPAYSREGYPSGGYSQAPGYDQRGFNDRSEYNGRQDPEADRKLREALGPLQENTVAVLLDNPDVVPQVLEEAQRHGNRIPDARVFEIVDQYRRGRYQAPPNAGGPPPSFSHYGSQQQQYGDMGPGAGYDHQYQQQYPPQQGPPGGPFMPGKRKADAMGAPHIGLMADAPQSKRPSKKNRGTLPCRYFASPMGCKHGGNCHYAHVQPVPANGPESIYINQNGPMMGGRGAGPMMGGRGAGPMERYGPAAMQQPGHHMRGGR
ncbi:hypothetical protein PF005_g4721 [Phytophthora fragariae]|uniref:Serine/threonine-protein phosphatase 1 regulatory subunit 10 n=1 Tax=Phytophthora fragariae TaxID=53985 RepID=A0A6A4A688_9STRA|nr:hypothetical protein PF003_g4777 [Phytophthora fragariae]KAE8945310.1 hypothetical protein PF009_g5048 [Phytophthora fragariae]KAE9024194.1 hypothetical protein PF011_g3634 [Phytophthora fragariae]KAE9129806.1 hypothetical protein PF007_g4759 [Phytophthora fragariae]KAE9129912.1 hypothetical protein PF010_g4045 [Phytophthora fragariae]